MYGCCACSYLSEDPVLDWNFVASENATFQKLKTKGIPFRFTLCQNIRVLGNIFVAASYLEDTVNRKESRHVCIEVTCHGNLDRVSGDHVFSEHFLCEDCFQFCERVSFDNTLK